MDIVILDGYTTNPGDLSWAGLEKHGDVTVYEFTHPHEVMERIAGAEIVYTNKTPLTKETFDACPSIRYVGVLATGYNVVDIAEAKKRGIVVTNVPAYSTPTVAQFTMALLLEIALHVGHHSRVVHEGKWSACRDFSFWDYPLMELAGMTGGAVVRSAEELLAIDMGVTPTQHDAALPRAYPSSGFRESPFLVCRFHQRFHVRRRPYPPNHRHRKAAFQAHRAAEDHRCPRM